MDHALRTSARRATDDDLAGRAAHLAARVRVGELHHDQVELAAHLGDPAALLVAGPLEAGRTWTAAVARWGPDLSARAALAAARACLPALERRGRFEQLVAEVEAYRAEPTEARREALTRRTLGVDQRHAPRAGEPDADVARRWAAKEACLSARVLGLWPGRAAPLRLAIAAGHAAHALRCAGLGDADAVLAQVRRELLPWLLEGRRAAPPPAAGPPRAILGWTDDEDALLPMLLVGWDVGGSPEGPLPRPLLTFWQQAGGHCFSRHPAYVGCALPWSANVERLGPTAGHLLCALDALGEDPRWEVLRARFPALVPLTWTDGAPYDARQLAALEHLLAAHVALPPLEPGGVEAALRLVDCDPLVWFGGWTMATVGPDGLQEGPPFDAAALEALVTWGRANGREGPPRVHLAWRNCD